VLFRNTVAQSSSVLLATVLSFLLTPLMFARLGLTQFGVWAVTGAIINYAQVMALGVTTSLSRFVAYHDGGNDRRGIEECLGLGLVTVAAVAALSGTAAALIVPALADALHQGDVQSMRIVVLCVWGMFAITLLRGVLSSVPVGLRQMVPPAIAANIGVGINFAASVAALLASRDLVVYALANAGASVLSLVATVVAFRSVWRPTTVRLPSRARARQVLGFSLKSQTTWIADQVNNQTDKVIIAIVIDVRTAATYEIAGRVVSAIKAIGVLTVSALIPTATAEIVRHGRAVVHDYFGRYTARSVAIAFPISVAAALAAPYLFVAWLGRVPPNTLLVMVVLTAANFVNVASGVAMTLSLAAGRPGLVATNAVTVAAVNLALTVALAPLFGLWGVLAGTFGAITGGTLVFIARFQREWQIPRGAFVRAVSTAGSLALGLAAPIALVEILLGDAPPTRAAAGAATLAICAVYAIPYWILASRLGILPAQLTYRSVLGRRRVRNARRPAPPKKDAGPEFENAQASVGTATLSEPSATASSNASTRPPRSR
jgi:O-antigen/teichoic acid export membrane protein